jgi:DNA-binding transcriptional LysR family regulator
VAPPGHLIGKSIAPLQFCVYGNVDYLKANGARIAHEHQWMALDDSYSGHRSLQWLASRTPIEQLGYRSSSFGLLQLACASGLGLAVLPCLLGDANGQLMRVGEPIPECESALWLLIHPDLRDTARIKAVFLFLHVELGKAMASQT